jgi:hypothetical protein
MSATSRDPSRPRRWGVMMRWIPLRGFRKNSVVQNHLTHREVAFFEALLTHAKNYPGAIEIITGIQWNPDEKQFRVDHPRPAYMGMPTHRQLVKQIRAFTQEMNDYVNDVRQLPDALRHVFERRLRRGGFRFGDCRRPLGETGPARDSHSPC